MKTLVTLFFSFFSLAITAQPLTGSFTDCNNQTENIQATLGTGKALIIAHKGVDCIVCQNQAGALQTWASQNQTKVAVWGAMTHKYGSVNFNPPCQKTLQWKTNYSWNSIFTFPDLNRVFINNVTPRYYVYSPRDSTIKYNGSVQSTAFSVALAETLVGIEDAQLKDQLMWQVNNRQLTIYNESKTVLQLQIFDLNGKLLIEDRVSSNVAAVDLSNLGASIYLMRLSNSKEILAEKLSMQ